MNMKSSLVLVMLAGLSLSACNKKEETIVQPNEPVTATADAAVVDATATTGTHQPEVAVVDGVGVVLPQSTYTGTLPCADCSGVQTDLTLNSDGTFMMKQDYLGKPNGQVTTQGTYDINGVDNQYVLLHPNDHADTPPYLIYMDKDSVQFRDLENGETPTPSHTLLLVNP
ncbi:copper resistance protein NlpE [Moraxella catarrhalis]|uniref:OMP G1a n=1 Tax=Moraxella catarrhalis TaxID=480 RepID=Q6WPQ4_MORCA|nr:MULTISPECIES: copper resistance protein NlpE [Moraxella]AAQ24464.1 OMP G1a [Moraxella catarrhalis]AXT96783.1 membrane protein [Moraxella catarrhalis]EGE14689.1 outer membrane protein G1a OmpG1a [Moraxella catarrhalis 103P14B1]EGE26493.1 outer membrane protein G1a OmpG1a [Moraxella catarrhalis 101P30B1]EKF84178.1 outer membrane protein G1a OmpG1a [Moraxella catarrhalis RH4]